MAAPAETTPADTMEAFESGQEGISLPRPPVFATSAEERRHRKEQVAGACRIFGRFGFGEGIAGHITARDPEDPDTFWVNPFGMAVRHVRASDLLRVDHTGRILHGSRPVDAAGTPTLIDEENARFTREQTGSPYAGWFSFQPLWDEIVRTDPDLFD